MLNILALQSGIRARVGPHKGNCRIQHRQFDMLTQSSSLPCIQGRRNGLRASMRRELVHNQLVHLFRALTAFEALNRNHRGVSLYDGVVRTFASLRSIRSKTADGEINESGIQTLHRLESKS